MRWRDIRFEQPTEADADKGGNILMLHDDNAIGVFSLENLMYCIAWMPTSELPAFDPIPDPPEGWRFVEKGDAFDKRAKYWDDRKKEWADTGNRHDYGSLELYTYIVPIDPPKPPEPQYRPYDDAELSGLIGQVVNGVRGYRAMITGTLGSEVYCQGMRLTAQALLDDHAWLDGERCGVRIEQ